METQNNSLPLPYFFVGREAMSSRVADYHSNKLPLLSTAIGKPDTESIWYTKDHISKLLDEIEHAGGDGLRFYFGSYESDHPKFAGQTCILMTVTRASVNGQTVSHPDIFLEDQPDFEERSSLPRDLPESVLTGERNKEFNFGSPCPPLCD